MAEVDPIPPIVLSLIACDKIILDQLTGEYSLIGLFSTIDVSELPATLNRPIYVYCAMTNGHYPTSCVFRLVDILNNDEVIWQEDQLIEFTNPNQTVERIIAIQNAVFNREGEFRLQLCAGNDMILLERKILCRLRK